MFNPVFAHVSFANATQVLMCDSSRYKLENMITNQITTVYLNSCNSPTRPIGVWPIVAFQIFRYIR